MSEHVNCVCHECGNSSAIEPSDLEFHFTPTTDEDYNVHPLTHAVARFICSVSNCAEAHDPNFEASEVLELTSRGAQFVLYRGAPNGSVLARERIPNPEAIQHPIDEIEDAKQLHTDLIDTATFLTKLNNWWEHERTQIDLR